MKQCWIILNQRPGNKLQWNLYHSTSVFCQENASENPVLKTVTIFVRLQCNTMTVIWDTFPRWVILELCGQLRSSFFYDGMTIVSQQGTTRLDPLSNHKSLGTFPWVYHTDTWACFSLLLGVSSGCARPITGQVTSVTWPVIGWA